MVLPVLSQHRQHMKGILLAVNKVKHTFDKPSLQTEDQKKYLRRYLLSWVPLSLEVSTQVSLLLPSFPLLILVCQLVVHCEVVFVEQVARLVVLTSLDHIHCFWIEFQGLNQPQVNPCGVVFSFLFPCFGFFLPTKFQNVVGDGDPLLKRVLFARLHHPVNVSDTVNVLLVCVLQVDLVIYLVNGIEENVVLRLVMEVASVAYLHRQYQSMSECRHVTETDSFLLPVVIFSVSYFPEYHHVT